MTEEQNPKPDPTEAEIEEQIQAKGLTAPRITPEHIEACIAAEDYHVFDGTTTTVCCLILLNGFTVIGASYCANPADFDPEKGRQIARKNASEKIGEFEAYALSIGL